MDEEDAMFYFEPDNEESFDDEDGYDLCDD